MNVLFFSKPAEFRKWLEKNHDKETELLVGFYKVSSKKPTMTWSEAVDQALCFGWIDGIKRTVDEESYCLRFTPRKKTSTWSAINIRKVAALKKAGLMTPAGLEVFKNRKDKSTVVNYAHEKVAVTLDPVFEKQFRKNKRAWNYFTAQPPGYKKLIYHWIMNAKQEVTRLSRLKKVIDSSSQQKRM